MRPILSVATSLVVGLLLYMFSRLYKVRKEMEKLPSPPRSSFLMGNLLVANDCEKHFTMKIHPHAWVHYISKKYNMGKFFYVDLWPFGPRWLFITDAEIVSQYVTSGQSLLKSPLFTHYLNKLLGDDNMVSLDGPQWKKVRAMFNPGFASGHLMTLLPYIVDASVVFREIMREKAKTGELFEMEEYATRLTIDIMGKVVLDSDFNAQHSQNPIVETFRKQVTLMPPSGSINPLRGLDLLRPFKLWFNSRKLDRLIGEELDKRFAAQTQQLTNGNHAASDSKAKPKTDRKRSVVDLALETYQKEFSSQTFKSPSSTMDRAFRTTAINQMKTFIFAGHDTTSSTIAYAYYLLHTHPKVHSRLVSELDSVLGPASTTASTLKSSPHLINSLPYTLAVLKETLRIFPPASTLRYAPVSSNLTFTDPDSGTAYPLTGCDIWVVSHAIHRSEAYFPRPLEFIPERFIPELTPFPDTVMHKEAWRPFEKGPRACIGQELAVLETKVILALTAREFDFHCEYPPIGGSDGSDGGKRVYSAEEKSFRDVATVEGHRCVQILKGSAKPLDGMPGRISLR